MKLTHSLILLFGALTQSGAFAHEGHGMPTGTHWHASDTLGFIGVALVIAVVWAIHKRK